jgi:hypothetical protein
VLLAVALLEETYGREIARVLAMPLITVQRIVDSLERDAVIAVRTVGRQRMVALNPRFLVWQQLRDLLWRLADADTELVEAVSCLRRRPRRKGKPL